MKIIKRRVQEAFSRKRDRRLKERASAREAISKRIKSYFEDSYALSFIQHKKGQA